MNRPRNPICILPVPPAPLASMIGPAGAAAIARALVDDAVRVIRPLPWARPVRASCHDVARILPQAMREHDGGAVYALDAASPGIPAARLEAARSALVRADAVIGPSDGGGVYLLGLRHCPRGLLSGLDWSAPGAFETARDHLRGRGLTPVVLDRWFSVGSAEVLERLRGLLRAGIVDATATASLLAPRISAIVSADGSDDAGLSVSLDSIDHVAAIDDVHVVPDPAWFDDAAARAHGDVLWFVRAGTRVPADADRHIVDALLDPEVVAGAFGTHRPLGDARVRDWLQPLARLADLRARLTGLPHAGQALFVRRAAFDRLGGMPPGLLGDLELARRLRHLGRIARVPARVEVVVPAPRPAVRWLLAA